MRGEPLEDGLDDACDGVFGAFDDELSAVGEGWCAEWFVALWVGVEVSVFVEEVLGWWGEVWLFVLVGWDVGEGASAVDVGWEFVLFPFWGVAFDDFAVEVCAEGADVGVEGFDDLCEGVLVGWEGEVFGEVFDFGVGDGGGGFEFLLCLGVHGCGGWVVLLSCWLMCSRRVLASLWRVWRSVLRRWEVMLRTISCGWRMGVWRRASERAV